VVVLEQALNGLQYGVMLFLMAAGLTLVFGIMNLVNLAHGSLYMVGAYLATAFHQWTGSFLLAVALALPTTLPTGGPFPARAELLIVTITVIVFTLVGQGLTLPWLIRALRLGADEGQYAEEAGARQRLIEAALHRIDQLYPVWPGHRPLLDQLRGAYEHRSEHVERQREAAVSGDEDQELIEHREIRRTVIDAERETLLRLRAEGAIDDDVLRELERELDLEERRMDA